MRFYETHALGLNVSDTQFDKDGMGYSFSAVFSAESMEHAEELLRKDKRFRRMARQNDEDWRTVPVVVRETARKDFGSDVVTRRVSMRRASFLKRVSA